MARQLDLVSEATLSPISTAPNAFRVPDLDYLPHDLDLDLEGSDNTLFKHDEAVMRASDMQHPFAASKLQRIYDLGDSAMEVTMNLYRARADREREFVTEQQAIVGLNGKSPNSKRRALPPVSPPPLSWRTASKMQDERQWKLVKEVCRDQDKIRVYRNERRRQRTTTMMAQGILAGSLSKVMDGLYAEKTKDARVLYGLLSDKFLDTAVLHVDSYPTAQQPFQFAGVTWMALEGVGPYGVCKDRDFLCFKRTGTFEDETGNEFGYLSLQSIDTDESAALLPYLGPAQASMTSGYIRGFISLTIFFKPVGPDCVYMFAKGDFSARGHLARRLSDTFFADVIAAFGNAGQCGQAKNLAVLMQSMNAGHLPPGGVVGNSGSSRLFGGKARCGVCSKTLWKVLQAPEFCRSCWTRTCRKCQVTLPIYCADFHRSHGGDCESGPHLRKTRRRIAKPCRETFCVTCLCTMVPFGIQPSHQDNRSSMATMATPNPRAKKKTRTSMGHYDRRSSLRGGAAGSAHSVASKSSASMRNSDQAPQVVVQLPRYGRHAIASFMTDDHSSISVMSSSVESEKYRQRRLHIQRPSRVAVPPPPPIDTSLPNPKSMVEVLENLPYRRTPRRLGSNSDLRSRGRSGIISLISFDSSPTSVASSRVSRVSRKRHVKVLLKKSEAGTPTAAAKAARTAMAEPATAATSKLATTKKASHDDEYYHKMLRGYLTARRSSLAHTSDDASSITTSDNLDERDLLDKTVDVIAPPISADRPLTPSIVSVSSIGSY